MKFNYKNRGFVVLSLSLMLIAVGVVNYQLSKDSTLSVSDEFKAYEQAQIDKNSPDDTTLVDSIDGKVTTDDKDKSTETSNSKDNTKDTAKENSDVENLAKETSKEIEDTLNSKENIDSDTYIVDMKMTREKQRNQLTEQLNEIINNPSTADEAKVEASNMKVSIVKNSDTELQIENLLLAKGYDEAIVFIDGDKANVVVNMEEIKQNDATKIFDIVSNQSGISRENIKLTNNR
ncbi:MAG: SpoIIIAH-like family protein [Clostridiales bacterium]|jgi:stage III sporulation protein AH|uniref:SpoIIIAH-like family protein n=1 Tax=Clostridia TaxID=186801 RepID=UPI0018A89B62|nr:SpoIIIAH-like family protein [Clostridium sp. 1001270J_160509_D11]MDU1202335.1 SpoIIIAH-like family protein [Clostridiales bacterium]